MSFISIGKIDKSHIPLLIGCVFCFLNRLLNQYDGTLLFKNVIITNIVISFSRIFALLPHIILKIRTKRETVNNNNNNINIPNDLYLYTDNEKKIIKGKFGFIIFSAVIFFIQSILFLSSLQIKVNSWILYILGASIFSYIIFKDKLYKHHYLSIILIILIGVVIDLVLETLQYDISNNLLQLLLRLLREILFSFHHVIAKYIMEAKFVSVYEMTFYNGIINLILLGITFIFDYYYFKIDNYEEYFNNFNVKELLVVLGVMSTQLGLNLSSLFTIRNNSACHVFIMLAFGQMAYLNISQDAVKVIICLIFILFLTLIFNEIIEINFWGLSYNTKRNIIARAESKDEFNISMNETIDSSNDGDDEFVTETNTSEEIYN